MKIEKEVIFKMELEKEEIYLIKDAIGNILKDFDALGSRESELASELHKRMCQVILDLNNPGVVIAYAIRELEEILGRSKNR